MKTNVPGINLQGENISIPIVDLEFRPSGYGLVINDDKIALLTSLNTGKYLFPGGGIDLGESMEEGMRREVLEEAGLIVKEAKLIDCNDVFFEYTPDKYSFHSIQFFYICTVESTELAADDKVDDGEAIKPRWIDIASLTPDNFQNHGTDIIERLLAKIQ